MNEISKAASIMGRKGGNKNKEKGSEYFSRISKMSRKHEFCTLEDCENNHHAKGLCSKHYQREFVNK